MGKDSTTRRHGAEHERADHYQAVTDRIVAALEAGTPPWRKPWDPDKAGGPAMPRNATTGVRYRGINTLLLGMSALAFDSGDPRWATYKQANERGWQVKRGERGTMGVFFKRLEVRDGTKSEGDEDATRRIPLLRTFTLFHTSQMDGAPAWTPPSLEQAPWRTSEAVDLIVRNSGAVVRVGGDRAFYSPSTQHIQMPPASAFATLEGYTGTLVHELAHSTASPDRLDRDLRNAFGSHDYAREELRAEIGQTMILAELGLGGCEFENNAAYVADWLKALRSDRKEIFRAAADAQKIADYLLAFHPAYAAQAAGPSPGGEQQPDVSEAERLAA